MWLLMVFATNLNLVLCEVLSHLQIMNKKQIRYDTYYMSLAKNAATMSFAVRLKVGAILVKDGRIIADAWNGAGTGFENICEDEDGETLPHIIHAEENVVIKVAGSTESALGGVLYITHSPCVKCARLLAQLKISRVVYLDEYRDEEGKRLLELAGVLVESLT